MPSYRPRSKLARRNVPPGLSQDEKALWYIENRTDSEIDHLGVEHRIWVGARNSTNVALVGLSGKTIPVRHLMLAFQLGEDVEVLRMNLLDSDRWVRSTCMVLRCVSPTHLKIAD